jgi:hypothetical protein
LYPSINKENEMINTHSFTQRGIQVSEGRLAAPWRPSKQSPAPSFLPPANNEVTAQRSTESPTARSKAVDNTQENINESYAKLLVALKTSGA